MIKTIKNVWNQDQYSGIIIDGCHTEWKTLKELLDSVRQYCAQATISLLLIGNCHAKCGHLLNNHQEGDYSDYNLNEYTHKSVPSVVFQKKKAQYQELLENHSDDIYSITDYIFVIPAYSSKNN